ncbi:MAG: amidohydrolase family protein [Halobacteriales archaeon]
MLEVEHGFRVVDVHARLDTGPAGENVDDRGPPTTPERLEREMRQAGIVRSVVFPGHSDGGYLRANNTVARHAVDRLFVAFARLNGPRDPSDTPVAKLRNLTASRGESHTDPTDVERYGYDDRFAGFKLDPLRDGLPDEAVLETLADVGLPVLVHVGEGFPPRALEATLLDRSFPVIIAHFGGYPLQRDYMSTTIDLLDDYDACYVDTSVVRFRDLLERALLEHPDRVLFGSGAPDVHPNVAVMELLTLDVSEDAMRKAFAKNATRVVPQLGADVSQRQS